VEDVATRGHAVVVLDDERVVLLREVRSGSVRYVAPGAPVGPGETPGRAAARAAMEQLGIEVEVSDLIFADTEMGAEHFFFQATPVGSTPSAWGVPSFSSDDGLSIAVVTRSALLGYPVRPIGIARRMHRRPERG
jgi:8-oxo-dGTP pyrophosphatase MutT (NUDIX family)